MKISAGLIGAFLGFLTLGSLSPLPLSFIWFCGICLTTLLILQWVFAQKRNPLYFRFLLVLQFLLSFLLASSYANHILHRQLSQRDFQPQMVTTQVRVVDISQSVGNRVRQVVSPVKPVVGLPEKWLISPTFKQQEVVADSLNQMKAGDVWQLTAKIRPPHGVASQGVFSEQRWLLGLKVAGRAEVSEAKFVKQSAKLTLKERLANYRLGSRVRIVNLSDNPQYDQDKAVLLGLLTGDRALIDRDTKDLYQHMGISHLLAISGPHVLFAASMFAFLLIKLLNLFPRTYKWLPKRSWVLPSSLLVALGYALLSGWDLPAQRTVLMFAITVFLLFIGKHLSFWWVMLLSATVILMIDPLAVLSAGFWLSFVAVGLLVLLSQSALLSSLQTNEMQQLSALQKPNDSDEKTSAYVKKFKAFLSLQLVFFIAILPITLLFFGKASLLTPFVNLVAIPLLGLLVVPLNIVAFLVDMLSPTLANGIWNALLWVLHAFHGSMAWLQGAFPTALVGLHLDKTALWACALLLLLWLLPMDKRLRFASLPLALLILMPRQLPAPAVVRVFDGTTFTATLVQVQKNGLWQTQQNMLYLSDIQPKKQYEYELESHFLPSLTAYDVGQIDTLVVSVSDKALPTKMLSKLVKHFNVQNILTNADTSESSFHNANDRVKLKPCDSKTDWQWGQVSFNVLSPWDDVPVAGNDAACTLKISVAKGQQPLKDNRLDDMLLMGNASPLTENMMLALCEDLSADVLLLPRQGHQTGTQSPFLKTVNPKYAVTAVTTADYRGLPHLQTQATLMLANVPLNNTAKQGTLTYYLGSHAPPFNERDRWPWLKID